MSSSGGCQVSGGRCISEVSQMRGGCKVIGACKVREGCQVSGGCQVVRLSG
jgi:hypothetical protein